MGKCNKDENFAYFTCFTDECIFNLMSENNKQIHGHWTKENHTISSKTKCPG